MTSAGMAGGAPIITRRTVGDEAQPLVVIDRFAPDPGAWRAAAAAAEFSAAGHHYPGIRAPLPAGYMASQLPAIAAAMGRAFGRFRRLRIVDGSFAIVTTPPSALTIRQSLPHVDAYGPERIALVQYLSLDDCSGTAFFRHRSTGFETIDTVRAPGFFAALDKEMDRAAPVGYIADTSDLFDRIATVDARYNRAILYRSMLLHSGAIPADAHLSGDPATGRLTVTAFLAME